MNFSTYRESPIRVFTADLSDITATLKKNQSCEKSALFANEAHNYIVCGKPLEEL